MRIQPSVRQFTPLNSALLPGNQRKMRILFAPHEICGQMQLLAEAFRAQGHDAVAANFGAPHPFSPPNDICLRLNERTRVGRFARATMFAAWAIRRFDVFHFFYGRSLLPNYLDLPLLKRLGKRVIVHFRGSDIRSESWLQHVVERQLTGREIDASIPASTPAQVRRVKVWRRYADQILVSIPELKAVVPEATVLQQAIDVAKWPYRDPQAVPGNGRPLRIAHVTTKRVYKGTSYAIDAVDELTRRGRSVELDLIENVAHEEVRRRLALCDIGVDELIQGSYGNVAIEMMAMGIPVVANLCPWYATNRPDLPIVDATPQTVAQQLDFLLADKRRRETLSHAGRRYVERWHDVHKHVACLVRIYRGESPDAAAKVFLESA